MDRKASSWRFPVWMLVLSLAVLVVLFAIGCTALQEVHKTNLRRHAMAAAILQEQHGVEITPQELEEVYAQALVRMSQSEDDLDDLINDGIMLQQAKEGDPTE